MVTLPSRDVAVDLSMQNAGVLCLCALGGFLAFQAITKREAVVTFVKDSKRLLLFWRSMHRRFENQRLDRLSVVGEGRRSNWMWKKSSGGAGSNGGNGGNDGNESELSSEHSTNGSPINLDEQHAPDDAEAADGLMSAQKKLVLVMVGLPARGKSFVVHKATRYIEWLGFPTKVFNVGNYRRKRGLARENAAFFSASNPNAKKLREELAMQVLDDLLEWLETEGYVAVFDATNTTKMRRENILERVCTHAHIRVMFVENICDNQDLLEQNYKRKLMNDDYTGMDPESALLDFKRRVAEYEKVYQTLEDSEDNGNACYVKVYNAGEKIQARFCQGFLPSHIVSLLQNIHLFPRRIWLVSPGPSITSIRGILGLDTDLTPEGHCVAKAIANFMSQQRFPRPFELWTSAMKRSRQTAAYVPTKYLKRFVGTTLLNELGGGDFEGLTYTEIRQFYPQHYYAREKDKLRYRYPGVGGESYVDLIGRLRSLIIEFERKKRDVLVICNDSVLRCLLGYFTGTHAEKVPYLDAYENTVVELSPHQDGCDMKLIPLQLDDLSDDDEEFKRGPRLVRSMST